MDFAGGLYKLNLTTGATLRIGPRSRLSAARGHGYTSLAGGVFLACVQSDMRKKSIDNNDAYERV